MLPRESVLLGWLRPAKREKTMLPQESVLLCWVRPARGRLAEGRSALRGMDSVGLIAPASRSHRAVQPQFVSSAPPRLARMPPANYSETRGRHLQDCHFARRQRGLLQKPVRAWKLHTSSRGPQGKS